jgi:hypothetical protein
LRTCERYTHAAARQVVNLLSHLLTEALVLEPWNREEMWTRESRVDDFEFGMEEAEVATLRQQPSQLEIFEGFGHAFVAPKDG